MVTVLSLNVPAQGGVHHAAVFSPKGKKTAAGEKYDKAIEHPLCPGGLCPLVPNLLRTGVGRVHFPSPHNLIKVDQVT